MSSDSLSTSGGGGGGGDSLAFGTELLMSSNFLRPEIVLPTSSKPPIDDHAKDGGPDRSDLDVVFTMILCATNYFIW